MYKSLRIIFRVIGIILCVVLIPVLTMNVTIIVKSFINPDKVPDFFGIKPFVVVSGSMEPTIMTNDLVISKAVDPKTLKTDDIISFREGDSVVTHRIIEISEENGEPVFITKGDWDGAAIDQNPVTYSQVEGKYLFRVAKVGGLALFMQKPVGMLVFIGIPLAGFILYDIIRRRMQNRKEQQAENEKQAEIDALKAMLEEKEKEE